uniref:Uncharacterized protein n=1 Tax=Nelumbo nucifera TaxID=4432 RepID=A0A822XXL7_NELNU|nr:TPA_asm: hypothetical protein HUJ06_023601 [Nelumbo nucifera]
MSCFLLPQSLCDELTETMRKFWWGERNSKNKIHWMNWELLCKPKQGGLEFRDPKAFNLALLAKQAWRVLTKLNSLLNQVLFGKYCRNNTFLQSKPRSKCSWGWRSLMAGKEVLLKGLFMQVGNGEDINF